MKHLVYLIFIIGFACQPTKESQVDQPLVDTVTIAKHIKTLASDAFLGRKPFTAGEVKTLAYLENEFKSMGLKPGNGDSYFQEVPMVELDAKPSATMIVSGNGKEVLLNRAKDFVAITERVVEKSALDMSELVFAGYGVVAPEYGWDDYAGLDVKGKTVIVLVNDPGFGSGDSTFFKGQTMTYYGRWTYKYEEAARQGADGIFIIHDTAPAGYPWLVVQNGWSGASLYLDQAEGQFKPKIQGWLTRDAAIKIFEASEVDMKGYVGKARTKGFKPFSLNLSTSVSVENGIKSDVSQNVVAKIVGSEKPDEVIIYTAHWDHMGVGPVINGDSIYNGAHDNASGTASILAIAQAMSKLPQPKRSIVFLAITAEEQGLLGSKYYGENPIYDPKKSVANINIDGLNYFGLMKDFTVVGYGQSELDDIARKYVEAQGRYVLADQDPGKGYFFRSDHFQFAKIGIPAMFASGAYEAMVGGVAYVEKKQQDYLENKYHRPADEFDAAEWKFGGILQDAEVFYKMGLELANSDTWPKWKEGSEFKSIREK